MGQHGEGARGQAGQPVSLSQVHIIMWNISSLLKYQIKSVLKGALGDGASELENHPLSGF